LKITRVRFYASPISRPMFNQSFHIVTVETDQGITGIGEGGSRDTIQECAEMLIGEDPTRIDYCWQLMFRGRFYPAAREKLHAMGALDMALWDIKGKALNVPVYELLGGKSRDHVECYSTGFIPNQGSLKETARATIAAGFRAFRTSVADRWFARLTRIASPSARESAPAATGASTITRASTSPTPCG
jgi:L-alanine-DL-glutamate epimerase-like enolase superfamily enzyme